MYLISRAALAKCMKQSTLLQRGSQCDELLVEDPFCIPELGHTPTWVVAQATSESLGDAKPIGLFSKLFLPFPELTHPTIRVQVGISLRPSMTQDACIVDNLKSNIK